MHGLKLNITFTFILLLATGMLLVNVVMSSLWQHSLTDTVSDNSKTVLKNIITFSGNNVDVMIKHLSIARENAGASCSVLVTNNTWQTMPPSGCINEAELRTVIDQSMDSGKPVSRDNTKIMSIFSPHKRFLYVAVPIIDDQGVSGAIGMAHHLHPALNMIKKNQRIILVYILVNTLILTIIGFFRFDKIVIRPIDRLVQETSSYTGEKNLAFVSKTEGSEFRQLSSAINAMVSRIDKDNINLKKTVQSLEQANEKIQSTQQEMIRTEKLASVGRMSAGLAHEIGNPLGVVLGYLGMLKQKKVSDEDICEYIERSEQELNRINLLVRQLLDFSRPSPATIEPIHVHSLLENIIEMLEAQKNNTEISFINELLAENDIIHGHKDSLHQAFMNFFLNSLDAIHETEAPERGIILIKSNNITDESNKTTFQVTINDNGYGINPSNLANVFDPFFTTKEPGKGTGLGLSVSHTIIESTGGTVYAESTEGHGTSIIIELPNSTD